LLHVHVGHGEESIFGNPSTGITACFGHLRDGQYALIDMLLVISHWRREEVDRFVGHFLCTGVVVGAVRAPKDHIIVSHG
jgi:hypothetical protein